MDYAEFLELARDRRSVRRFQPLPVSEEDLDRLLEAARWAPSNHNRQGWLFVVFTDAQEIRSMARRAGAALREKLARAALPGGEAAADLQENATFFGEAPALVLVLHRRPTALSGALMAGDPARGLIAGEPLSAAMAVQNLLLAAHALGLGACVMTAPLMVWDSLSSGLDLPPGHEPTCLVALGHPAEAPPAPRRKRIDQVSQFRRGT